MALVALNRSIMALVSVRDTLRVLLFAQMTPCNGPLFRESEGSRTYTYYLLIHIFMESVHQFPQH